MLIFAALILTVPADAAYETGGVIKMIMSNGVTLLVYPEPESSVVAIEIFARVGAQDETPSTAGTGHLLAGSILSGTEGRAPLKLSRLVSEVGGNFRALWQWNYVEVYAVTVPSMWSETLGLLADSVQESTLDQRAIDFSRTSIIRQISHQEDDLFNSAYTALRRLIHYKTPYDRAYLGESSAIKSITQQNLKDFYARNFSSDRIVISVAGNVDPAAVQRRVDIRFGNMKRSRLKETPQQKYEGSNGDVVLKKQGSASYIMVGYPAAGVDDPDYPAMCVANVILGGNKSSLLFSKLREELGLGYQVGSLFPALKGGSHIAAYLGMDSSRATQEVIGTVRKTMEQQFDALSAGSFADDDLVRAKRYLIGSHALKHERTRDRAFNLGWHEAVGLGYQYDFLYGDKMNAVTRADVMRVCAKYFTKPSFVVVQGTSESAEAGE